MARRWGFSDSTRQLLAAARSKADEIADAARARGDEIADAARERADEVHDEMVERAREARDDVQARLDSPVGKVVVSGLKKGAPIAVGFAPIELVLSAAGIAIIIKLADEKGLLESPNAKPLKDIALMIEKQIPIDETLLLNCAPKIFRMGLVGKVFKDAKALDQAAKLATIAKQANGLKNVIKKLGGHGGGPSGPGR